MELVFDTDVLIALSCGVLITHVEAEWPDGLVVPGAVADELARKVATDANLNCGRYPLGLPWVQHPVMFRDEEHKKIQIHRLALAGPSAHPCEHAGESEVLHYCSTHPAAIAVLNDRDARGRASHLGLEYWDTVEVTKRLVGAGHVSCDEAHGAYTLMLRASRMPPGLSATDFCVAGCMLH